MNAIQPSTLRSRTTDAADDDQIVRIRTLGAADVNGDCEIGECVGRGNYSCVHRTTYVGPNAVELGGSCQVREFAY